MPRQAPARPAGQDAYVAQSARRYVITIRNSNHTLQWDTLGEPVANWVEQSFLADLPILVERQDLPKERCQWEGEPILVREVRMGWIPLLNLFVRLVRKLRGPPCNAGALHHPDGLLVNIDAARAADGLG